MSRRLVALAVLVLTLFAAADAHAGSPRIAGGYVPHPSNWPWLTALVSKNSNDSFCTATLVAPDRVLTAAHCVYKEGQAVKSASSMQVLVGRKNLDNNGEGQRINVSSVVVHPKVSLPTSGPYTNQGFYDVAVLFLETPSSLTPAPVGTANTWGSWATVMGWGHVNYDHSNPVESPQVRAADLDLWNDSTCREWAYSYVPEIHICAGDNDLRDCITHGDSGGPLMVRTNGVWELVGVTSFYPRGDRYECAVVGFAWAAGPTLREWILGVPRPTGTSTGSSTAISQTQVDRYIPTVIGQKVAGRIVNLRRSCQQASATEIRCSVSWRINRTRFAAAASFFHFVSNGRVLWDYRMNGKRYSNGRVSSFAWRT